MYNKLKYKIVAIVEARMTSSRLPGKVLLPLAGKPSLERLIERLKRSKFLDGIVIATTINKTDDPIVELANNLSVGFFRGSELDVLKRVLLASQSANADIIVEITGDCPLVDWRLVDKGIDEYFKNNVDYASNIIKLSYPIGFDVQVFSSKILSEIDKITNDPNDRTHVSYYIYNHPEKYKLFNWKSGKEDCWPDLRLTLDEKDDYEFLNIIFENLFPINNDFSAKDIINFLKNNPKLLNINKNVRKKDPREG